MQVPFVNAEGKLLKILQTHVLARSKGVITRKQGVLTRIVDEPPSRQTERQPLRIAFVSRPTEADIKLAIRNSPELLEPRLSTRPNSDVRVSS